MISIAPHSWRRQCPRSLQEIIIRKGLYTNVEIKFPTYKHTGYPDLNIEVAEKTFPRCVPGTAGVHFDIRVLHWLLVLDVEDVLARDGDAVHVLEPNQPL